jgi:hypothetical protein
MELEILDFKQKRKAISQISSVGQSCCFAHISAAQQRRPTIYFTPDDSPRRPRR